MGRSERYRCQAYPASLAVRQIRRLSPDYSSVEDFPENPGSLDFADGFYGQTGVHESVRGALRLFPNITLVSSPRRLTKRCWDKSVFRIRSSAYRPGHESPRAGIAVFERLFEHVPPGGVIVFDDYGWEMFHKQKEAEDDFMRGHDHGILESPTGQGLVIRR